MMNKLVIAQLQNHNFVVSYRKNDQNESYHLLNCKMKAFFLMNANSAYFSFSDDPEKIYHFELSERGLFRKEDLKELVAHCCPKKTFMMKHGKLVGNIIVALVFFFGFWLANNYGEGYNIVNEYKWDRMEQDIAE